MPRKTSNPIDKHVGSRVRMRRHMLEMSQTEIAAAVGLTFQQVQKYENGSNRISASRLQQLCKILQVPRIGDAKVRRAIVALVRQVVSEPDVAA
jgi:transcriptional regulator with XRE-family HTH domain